MPVTFFLTNFMLFFFIRYKTSRRKCQNWHLGILMKFFCDTLFVEKNGIQLYVKGEAEMFHIVICDDEEVFINYFKELILESGINEDEVLFYTYASGEDFIKNISWVKCCDLLILDMQMKKYDGQQTAQLFRERFPKSLLVFCSGERTPTFETFKVMPFRYLSKEYGREEMKEEIGPIITEMRLRKNLVMLAAKHEKDTILIDPDDVLYIENYRYGSIIHVLTLNEDGENTYITREKLSQLIQRLANLGFEYAHNSYIVNLNHVARLLTNGEVVLVNGEALKVSRSKKKNFKTALLNWVSRKHLTSL